MSATRARTRPFANRRAAGRELGERLRSMALEDPVVIGLARGGVPVAYEVAEALGAPLDLLVVRKIGAPGNPELGIGAIAEGGGRFLDPEAVRRLMVSVEELESALARSTEELEQRVRRYRAMRSPIEVRGRTAIVVDDGLATGGTARAALRSLRARGPRRLILAVPVGSSDVVRSLDQEADAVVCLLEPEPMVAVGLWYEQFEPTSDAEIVQLLDGDPADPPPASEFPTREVRISVAEIVGDLVLPENPRGVVLWAQASGSSRFGARSRDTARALNEHGLGTLLVDLLRWNEERDRTHLFDISLLSRRLMAVTRWLGVQPDLAELPIGYLGSGTGAAAALSAAAGLGHEVGAVVSYLGRPDLVTEQLSAVRAPVLFIVGGEDPLSVELNEEARRLLRAPSELAVVSGASQLPDDHKDADEVLRLAVEWYARYLKPVGASAG